MGEGDHKVIKFLLLVFNLLFWVSGIGLIIAGALAQTVYQPYILFINSSYVSAPVLLIVIGAIISIIAFFGCCGSSKENYCMLITFAVLLSIIFVVELAGGIAAYVEKGRVQGYLADNLKANLGKYNVTDNSTTGLYDKTQRDGQCCGVDTYRDWYNNNTFFNKTFGLRVPESCCNVALLPTNVTSCARKDADLAACSGSIVSATCPIYTVGCLPAIKGKLENSIAVIGGVAIAVAFIQFIGIAFACILARRVRRGYTYN
ncbi:putative CD63 antigen [Hypsibius exemplaris]|uniref:Tetraspanin n=1 Tax=Hypsibius exemplaris TaxID=2072580 RepID=A0A9X6RM83_HYPEX|nr:putative CD63 antigen [Hypsibius exemplaris]